jgi:two-component system response regulator DesR
MHTTVMPHTETTATGGIRLEGLVKSFASPTGPVRAGTSPLTAREAEVLSAAARHGTVADISQALHLTEGTVRNYLSASMRKLGARNRSEAVDRATEKGWL